MRSRLEVRWLCSEGKGTGDGEITAFRFSLCLDVISVSIANFGIHVLQAHLYNMK